MGTPKRLSRKLVQLKLNVGRTQQILDSDNDEATGRKQRALKVFTSNIERLMSEVGTCKIANKGEFVKIEKWDVGIEAKLTTADQAAVYTEFKEQLKRDPAGWCDR